MRMNCNMLIVYSSPAGTTRHVSRVIDHALKQRGYDPLMIDLGCSNDCSTLNVLLKDSSENHCLWIGSPVYAGHAVPPVMEIISQLPEGSNNYAVPFVTWGAVTSGIALYEMANRLAEKGYDVLGAAKIVAVHSMMLDMENPLGEGHPDGEDDDMIRGLVENVAVKLEGDTCTKILPEGVNYQPKETYESLKKISIQEVKKMFPHRQIDEDACTQCGTCIEVCPAGAVTLDPFPMFGDKCFLCYNCVRLCEHNAIKIDLTAFKSKLKDGAKKMNERPLSQIIV